MLSVLESACRIRFPDLAGRLVQRWPRLLRYARNGGPGRGGTGEAGRERHSGP